MLYSSSRAREAREPAPATAPTRRRLCMKLLMTTPTTTQTPYERQPGPVFAAGMHQARVDRPARRLLSTVRPIPRSGHICCPMLCSGEGSEANGPSYFPSFETETEIIFLRRIERHTSLRIESTDDTDGKSGLIRSEPVRDGPPGHGPRFATGLLRKTHRDVLQRSSCQGIPRGCT